MDLGIAIGLAGVFVALALGIPSIVRAFKHNANDETVSRISAENQALKTKLDSIERSIEKMLEGLKSTNKLVGINRAIFEEACRSGSVDWQVASKIFNDADRELRRKILHISIGLPKNENRKVETHLLATDLGDSTSIYELKSLVDKSQDLSEEELVDARVNLKIIENRLGK